MRKETCSISHFGFIHVYFKIKHFYFTLVLLISQEDQDVEESNKNSKQKTRPWGFPGGAVVRNPPANAGDTGSCPGPGRFHRPRSNRAREPQLLSLRVWNPCSAMGEAAIVRGPRTTMKSGPHLPQLEKALAQKRRPNTAK